jgi:hypothetical protein
MANAILNLPLNFSLVINVFGDTITYREVLLLLEPPHTHSTIINQVDKDYFVNISVCATKITTILVQFLPEKKNS